MLVFASVNPCGRLDSVAVPREGIADPSHIDGIVFHDISGNRCNVSPCRDKLKITGIMTESQRCKSEKSIIMIG